MEDKERPGCTVKLALATQVLIDLFWYADMHEQTVDSSDYDSVDLDNLVWSVHRMMTTSDQSLLSKLILYLTCIVSWRK